MQEAYFAEELNRRFGVNVGPPRLKATSVASILPVIGKSELSLSLPKKNLESQIQGTPKQLSHYFDYDYD